MTNYKEIARVLPIGKLEEIVRCLYQPDCQHSSVGVIKAKLAEDLVVTKKDGSRRLERLGRIEGLLENSNLTITICDKCSRTLNV